MPNQQMEIGYANLKNVFELRIHVKLKMTTYGVTTWTTTEVITEKMELNQTVIEWKMLEVTLEECKTNTWLKDKKVAKNS